MTQYFDWKVGDRVVCVEETKAHYHRPLVVGKVYVIRSFLVHPGTGEVGVRLVGVENGVSSKYGIERGYQARRFRKVEPKKTDISIFTSMLRRVSSKVTT